MTIKLAHIGSSGYLGHNLFKPIDRIDLRKFDAGLYGPVPKDTELVDPSCPFDLARKIKDWAPDIIVNTAALAHDPKGLLPAEAVWASNFELPSLLMGIAKLREIHISSLSVFDAAANDAPYIGSKRAMERALTAHPFFQKIHVLRFGTVYGWDTPHPSIRTHLLLNRMTIDAVLHNKISVNGARSRPVTSFKCARNAIRAAAFNDAPGGTVSNHITACDTLKAYALQIADLVSSETSNKVSVIDTNEPDTRDYGWPGLPGAEVLAGFNTFGYMIHNILRNHAAFEALHTRGLQPLYDYFKARA